MSKLLTNSSERILPEQCLHSKEAYLLYLKHLFAYHFAKDLISGKNFIIEIGCGEGYGTNYLSQYVNHIVGLDNSEQVIQHASGKYRSKTCSFKLYDGSEIPYHDNTFDAVISFQVIEHVQDDRNYLAEIHRIVKMGGIFIMTTPNKTYRVKPGQKPWNRFHVREYGPAELERLLRSLFSNVLIWGIRGNDEIQNIEKARVTQAQKFAAMDPLNLRKLLPASCEKFIVNMLKKLLKRKTTTQVSNEFLNKYGVEDYEIAKENVEDCLDLLAICWS